MMGAFFNEVDAEVKSIDNYTDQVFIVTEGPWQIEHTNVLEKHLQQTVNKKLLVCRSVTGVRSL